MAVKTIFLMSIGKRIRELREAKKMTQKQLGKKVGVTAIQVGRYELGISNPSSDVLKKLAQALDTTSDLLMSGQHDKNVIAQLSDRELLEQFKMVQHLPEQDRMVVKTLIEAFLLKKQIQKLTG